MSQRTAVLPHGPAADPFGEQFEPAGSLEFVLLGGRFRFVADSAALLRLVESAFANVPPQCFDPMPQFLVRLRESRDIPGAQKRPPVATLHAGAGALCAIMDAANAVFIHPDTHTALITVSSSLLKKSYTARYELLEFAVFTLASRAQGLLSLHGACVGSRREGVLLLGASGAGKSTLTLQCLARGLTFLAEDSVHVRPDGLLATGIPNFLHLRRSSLRFIDAALRTWIRRSPIITRRSGVEKHEVDMRGGAYRTAQQPLSLVATVFISDKAAPQQRPQLAPLSRSDFELRLESTQPYATRHPGWKRFKRDLFARGAFELMRGNSPQAAAELIETLVKRTPPSLNLRRSLYASA